MSKIIDTVWFEIVTDRGASQMGIIATEDEVTGEKKLRIGAAHGENEAEAAQRIHDFGAKVPKTMVDFINKYNPDR